MTYSGEPMYSGPQRPTAVTVVAVVLIIFGALGVVSLPFNVVQMATGWRTAGPMGAALAQNPTLRTYMLVSLPLFNRAVCAVHCGGYRDVFPAAVGAQAGHRPHHRRHD